MRFHSISYIMILTQTFNKAGISGEQENEAKNGDDPLQTSNLDHDVRDRAAFVSIKISADITEAR